MTAPDQIAFDISLFLAAGVVRGEPLDLGDESACLEFLAIAKSAEATDPAFTRAEIEIHFDEALQLARRKRIDSQLAQPTRQVA